MAWTNEAHQVLQFPLLGRTAQLILLAILGGLFVGSAATLVLWLARRSLVRREIQRALAELTVRYEEQHVKAGVIVAENADLRARLEHLEAAQIESEAVTLRAEQISPTSSLETARIADETQRLEEAITRLNTVQGTIAQDEAKLLDERRQVMRDESEILNQRRALLPEERQASRDLGAVLRDQIDALKSLNAGVYSITKATSEHLADALLSSQANADSVTVSLTELAQQVQALNQNQRQIAALIAQASARGAATPARNAANTPITPRALTSIRFTAYYTDSVPVATWRGLRVYTHVESALEAVRKDVAVSRDILGDRPTERGASAKHDISRGDSMTVVPSCDGVEFRPKSVVFDWTDNWQSADFQYRADERTAGTTKAGKIRIFVDGLITAQIDFELSVYPQQHVEIGQTTVPMPREATSRRFQRVFGSYSHKDSRVVLAYRDFCKARNDEFYLDIDSLRPGRKIDPQLLRLIEQADVFQLFWSEHSAKNRHVRTEWEYAIRLNKGADFVLPVFWRRPLVNPPPELSPEWFVYVPLPKLPLRRWMFFKLFGYVG